MSAHEEQPTEASETHAAQRIDEAKTEFVSDLIEKWMKTNLKPIHGQFSTLTFMMNKLIQDISA